MEKEKNIFVCVHKAKHIRKVFLFLNKNPANSNNFFFLFSTTFYIFAQHNLILRVKRKPLFCDGYFLQFENVHKSVAISACDDGGLVPHHLAHWSEEFWSKFLPFLAVMSLVQKHRPSNFVHHISYFIWIENFMQSSEPKENSIWLKVTTAKPKWSART